MYQIIEKEVARNEFSTIPYTLIRSSQPNKTLCIMLPGLGYTTQRPLFHYATGMCINNHVDILHINYHFVRNEHFAKLDKMEQEQWMYEDVKTVVEEVINDLEYKQCFLLSKSIGTIPMAMEWVRKNFIQPSFGVWLTPLLKLDHVYEALLKTEVPSLCVIGDQDHHFLSERVSALDNNKMIRTLIIPNADHSLEIKGDISETIDSVKLVINSIEEFINHHKI